MLYLPGLWYDIEMCRLSKNYIQSESDPPSKKRELISHFPEMGSLLGVSRAPFSPWKRNDAL